jgi:hypothetical protein
MNRGKERRRVFRFLRFQLFRFLRFSLAAYISGRVKPDVPQNSLFSLEVILGIHYEIFP